MKHTDVVIKSTKSGLILHVKFEQLKKKKRKSIYFYLDTLKEEDWKIRKEKSENSTGIHSQGSRDLRGSKSRELNNSEQQF